MNLLVEERLIFLFVIISIPALVYAVERLTKRKVYNRVLVLLLYVVLTWFYIDKVEIYYRNKLIKQTESLKQETSYPQEPDPFIRALIKVINYFEDRVGGGVTSAVLPHHRAHDSIYAIPFRRTGKELPSSSKCARPYIQNPRNISFQGFVVTYRITETYIKMGSVPEPNQNLLAHRPVKLKAFYHSF